MKKCHACGQKLPLKTGDVVEGEGASGVRHRGTVLVTGSSWTDIVGFDRVRRSVRTKGLVRLHGYFRITEREPLG